MTERPVRARTPLPGISSRAWEHPADKGALVALRKLRDRFGCLLFGAHADGLGRCRTREFGCFGGEAELEVEELDAMEIVLRHGRRRHGVGLCPRRAGSAFPRRA